MPKHSKDEEISMMQSPEEWPQYVLPVKRYRERGKLPDTGVMLPEGRPVIYDGNLWDQKFMESLAGDGGGGVEIKKHNYASYEALVADGWIVD